MNRREVVVIGSGPAGVAAAWPLVQAGHAVRMLEAGTDLPVGEPWSLADRRVGGRPGIEALLGPALRGLAASADVSPKLRLAADPDGVDSYSRGLGLEADGATIVGLNVTGGLSTVWGAVSPAFSDADMAGWPIDAAALASSYRDVAARIGLSGSMDDDLAAFHGDGVPVQPALPPSPNAAALLSRYRGSDDFRLGRPRLAVLSAPLGSRAACDLGGRCMWGCARRSIYSAADEITALVATGLFALETASEVRRIDRPAGGGLALAFRPESGREPLRAAQVVLAAGTPASARLALASLGLTEARPLALTPAFTFALLRPAALGEGLPRLGFGLAQLAFRVPAGSGGYAYGLLYEAGALAAPDLVRRTMLTAAGGLRLLGALLPSLMIGLVYLPSSVSSASLRLAGDPERPRLAVSAATSAAALALARDARRRIAPALRRLGGWMLPGSFRMLAPGSEVHYAGPLAMGDLVSAKGEVRGIPGLTAVDGAVLPSLPAKHHTFTVMANADRIGRSLATRLRSATS